MRAGKLGETKQTRKLTGFEPKLAAFNVFLAEQLTALGLPDVWALVKPLANVIADRDEQGDVKLAVVRKSEKGIVEGDHTRNAYLNGHNEACISDNNNPLTTAELIVLARQIIEKLNQTNKNLLLQYKTIVPTDTHKNNMAYHLASTFVHLQNLQSILAELNEQVVRGYVERDQIPTCLDLFSSMNTAFVDISKTMQVQQESAKLSAQLDTQAPANTKASKDASPAAQILDMKQILSDVIEQYNKKRSYTGALTRFSFKARRDAQIDFLNAVINDNDPQRQMATLMAVYQSLESETKHGEKHAFFKSDLKKIIDSTLLKNGIRDFSQYGQVSRSKELDFTIDTKSHADQKELEKVLYHLNIVQGSPDPELKYLNALKSDLIARLKSYIDSKKGERLGANEGQNKALAQKLLNLLQKADFNINDAGTNQVIKALEGAGIKHQKTDALGHFHAEFNNNKHTVRSKELNAILKDVVDLGKMEHADKALDVGKTRTVRADKK